MSAVEERLRSEFNAEDGTFMLMVRCELRWDVEAFRRLTAAMYDVAQQSKVEQSVARWIAEGFWYCDTWIRDWTSHPNFPRPADGYDKASLELVHDLATFFFTGESPYEGDILQRRAKG